MKLFEVTGLKPSYLLSVLSVCIGGNLLIFTFQLRRRRLRVSSRNDLMLATIATGAPRRSKAQQDQFIAEYKAVLNVAPGLRRFGAAALDMAYVAAGRYEGFWERDLKSWDISAGIIIVKEAGGFIGDLDDIRKNPIQTGNILAGNAMLFDPLAKVLKGAGA